ncbi:MAG TPA: ATP-binding cassette domain-containing protein [Trebonia sp.]|jgi:ABC-type lipoprotein export system ATPase subunit|nr:ATP-binding cassette domain-containing protein [Trebonia sp.]
MGQYGDVVESGALDGGGVPQPGAELRFSAALELDVPPGQSVALLSQPYEVAVEILDALAGLGRPQQPGRPQPGRRAGGPGDVLVDGVAVDQLRGGELDRYRAGRGLLSPRFPLLPSRSVLDNVLAALPPGRVDARARERAAELLRLTGAAGLPAQAPAATLTAEQQWRVLIARALVPGPRLVLAEDPAAAMADHGEGARAVTGIWDLLADMHALLGFTLLVATARTRSALRCQRIVTLSGWAITDDELTSGDDPWTRGRIDRIG